MKILIIFLVWHIYIYMGDWCSYDACEVYAGRKWQAYMH